MSFQNEFNKKIDEALGGYLKDSRAAEFLKEKLFKNLMYTPKIGVMGKSGAGKSSLINAIIGQNLCRTGGVGGCTRAFQEERLNLGKREIIFMDLPGIAENTERDKEYSALYQEKLPELDLILWVIKVDDRANSADEAFFKWLTTQYDKERVIFVLSQCDKAEPTREWNYQTFTPGIKQKEIINQNRTRIEESFDVDLANVIPVACEFYDNKFSRYQLDKLVTRMVQCVPAEKKTAMFTSTDKANRTEEANQESKSAFENVFEGLYDYVADTFLPKPVATVAKVVKNVVKSVASKIYDFVTSWF